MLIVPGMGPRVRAIDPHRFLVSGDEEGGTWSLGLYPDGEHRTPVQDAAAALLSGTDPPIDLRTAMVESAPRPMLTITGGEVPREAVAARRLQQAAPHRVDLRDVPGAGHTGGLSAAAEKWDGRVGGFLERALLD